MLEGQRYTAYRVAHKVAIAIIFSQQPLVEAKELGQVFLQRLSPVLRLATHARQGNVKKDIYCTLSFTVFGEIR